MNFDVLIIGGGGGGTGMSCALVLGSAKLKPFAHHKKIGIIMHQKASALDGGLFKFATAAGSGTQVATDILTLWNDGQTTMIHDSEPK